MYVADYLQLYWVNVVVPLSTVGRLQIHTSTRNYNIFDIFSLTDSYKGVATTNTALQSVYAARTAHAPKLATTVVSSSSVGYDRRGII